jgi:hypothetical protein
MTSTDARQGETAALRPNGISAYYGYLCACQAVESAWTVGQP